MGILTALTTCEMVEFDLEKAYKAAKKGITEKTLAPWSGMPAGELDVFYKEHGFISSGDESESASKTLEYSYDDHCIATFAEAIDEQKKLDRKLAKLVDRLQEWGDLQTLVRKLEALRRTQKELELRVGEKAKEK